MQLLDIARSAYVASPASFRRYVAPLVALVPTSVKYGGSYRTWRRDIARSTSDFPFVAARREAAFRALIEKACAGSPFHRSRITEAFGSDLRSINASDIVRLPIATKEDLIAAGPAALAVPRDQLDPASTSGSNGERPFGFFRDRDRSVREIAFVHHVWERTGFRAGRPRALFRDAYLYDQNGFIHEWDMSLAELRLSVFPMTAQDMDLYIDLFDQRKIRFVQGFPSAIELLARHVLRTGHRPRLPLQGVLPTSEPIYPHQRQVIREAFDNPDIAPFYGLSEKAAWAGEVVGQDDVYEFEPLYGIAELIDDAGHPVTRPGQAGRIVGTSFVTTGMPFIRYDTEDRAVLVREGTAENGYRMRVRNIKPRRKPDFLVSATGEKVVSTDFTPYEPKAFKGVKEIQFYQDTPGRCTIRFVPEADAAQDDADIFLAMLQHKAGETLIFEMEKVDTLMASKNGKRPFIDQRLPI